MLAPHKEAIFYPESDGKPMAETDTHRNLLLRMVDLLQNAFPESYVSGNICLYYEEGNPRKMISPDTLLCRAQPKAKRRVYHAWEPNSQLDLVMEFSSTHTKREDHHKKKQIYANILKVPYYLIFDPHAMYLHFFELKDVGYQLIESNAQGHWEMPLLGIQVGLEVPNTLRLFDAEGFPILTTAEQEAQRADQAEQRARREAQRADQAEQTIQELQEELERLRKRGDA